MSSEFLDNRDTNDNNDSRESRSLRNIALTVSYDGTDFLGWQSQGSVGQRTVQSTIESALERMHGHAVPLIGSGRTDSGVHAAGQVANFFTDIASIPPERFIPALNSMLPRDVRIMDAREASPLFHARFSAKARTYRFFLHCAERAFAHELPFVWHLGRWPSLSRINEMASYLSGEIDCSTFAAAGDASLSKSRYLFGARFFPEGERLVFEITANAFLWRMVRSITGTIIDLERKGEDSTAFREILHSHDRFRAGPTAPGSGLFLWNVRY